VHPAGITEKKERKKERKKEGAVKALSHGLYRDCTYSPLCLVQALIPIKACAALGFT